MTWGNHSRPPWCYFCAVTLTSVSQVPSSTVSRFWTRQHYNTLCFEPPLKHPCDNDPLSQDSVTSTGTALISATIRYLLGRSHHLCPSSPFTRTHNLERLIRAEIKALERGATQHWKKDHSLILRWLNRHSIFHTLSSRGLNRNPCTSYLPRCLSLSPQTAFCIQKVAVKFSTVSLPMLPKGTKETKVTGIVTR